MARSGLPSASKSATVMALGPVTPAGRAKGEPVAGVKVEFPCASTPPRKTEKVLSAKLRTAKSLWPSPLKSAVTMALGVGLSVGFVVGTREMVVAGEANVPSPLLTRIFTEFVVGSVTSKSAKPLAVSTAEAMAGGTGGAVVRAVPREIGEPVAWVKVP